MRYILLLIVVLLSTNIAALSQGKFFIKGDIIDTESVQKMRDASIVILYLKDSTLVDFTRASPTGHFIINNLPQGKFLVLISYHDYADYVDTFDLDGRTPGIDFGTIGMVRKSTLLTEVLIKGRPDAIKIKGDTTEFNARSFVIQPNARVEDLLRQFPGIQVDKDGRITAQGQVVSKVLLDGEEFFGDDPTLVTKNIRADMVDKVQLFDKKSDQAAFTSIDDGVKIKTLNVILKEDKKNGYFGKVDAGVGTNGFYQDQALYNRFQGKQKFSVFATLSNTGKVGLNWQDGQKYGTTNNLQFGDSGNIFISGGGDDLETFNGKYNGQGIPTARTGGLHYDDKWNSDKVITNDNYKIMSLNVDGTKNVLAQYNLPGHIIRTDNNQSYHNYILRQKLDATFEFKVDTTSTFKVMVDGITNNTTSNNSYTQSSADSTNTTINNSIRGISSKMEQKTFDLTALYTKKFKKRDEHFPYLSERTTLKVLLMVF